MDRRPLYVRLPNEAAEKLDRAAFELRVAKQDLVADLVENHLAHVGGTRRVVVESLDDSLTVGHHSFTPLEEAEVMTLDEAATLLRIDSEELAKLAGSGDVPGRKLGDDWRFTRSALLNWLGNPDEEA
ncbi:MAG TPA: helix-turn-helix domain-containing protein [Thermoleophilaceae bacterium]|jgi:excisionase family DNA binding protein|nr:helix-turn-helix domain-containing protein [Thermoleophilaceae bacterium]